MCFAWNVARLSDVLLEMQGRCVGSAEVARSGQRTPAGACTATRGEARSASHNRRRK